MDPEQTFLRVHARFSGVLARLLTPKVRKGLEFACLFNAMTLLALLVVMHVNFVAQVPSLLFILRLHFSASRLLLCHCDLSDSVFGIHTKLILQ